MKTIFSLLLLLLTLAPLNVDAQYHYRNSFHLSGDQLTSEQGNGFAFQFQRRHAHFLIGAGVRHLSTDKPRTGIYVSTGWCFRYIRLDDYRYRHLLYPTIRLNCGYLPLPWKSSVSAMGSLYATGLVCADFRLFRKYGVELNFHHPFGMLPGLVTVGFIMTEGQIKI